MKYEYIKIHYTDEKLNLCTDHAVEINGGIENITDDLIFRNPAVEEVSNCIICDGEIELEKLKNDLK
mgnify:CR=1 FL=1